MPETPPEITRLLQRNSDWASKVLARNPSFFEVSANTPQTPQYLWISCSDSRVPVNEIMGGIPPGEIFVQRNIANIVHPTDLSLMSVLTYAVEHLKVKHIIVCGHYGCGGVKAGMANASVDLLDMWLRPIKDIQQLHASELSLVKDNEERFKIMCELNTLNSANSIAYTNVVQKAWLSGQQLSIRAWVYDLGSGLIRDLDFVLNSVDDIADGYRFEIQKVLPTAANNNRNSQVQPIRNRSMDRGSSLLQSAVPRAAEGRMDRTSPPQSAVSQKGGKSILRVRLLHTQTNQTITVAIPASPPYNSATLQKILNKIRTGLTVHGINPDNNYVSFLDGPEVYAVDDEDGLDFVLDRALAKGIGAGLAPLELVVDEKEEDY